MINFLWCLVQKIVQERPVVEGHFVGNFDGLRAVAALMVMSMHIKTIPNLAAGAPGVWLFFALSGYLLYSGFLRFSEEVDSKNIFAYLVRRVFRIIPLYLVFVVFYAYIFKGWPIEAKNTFFLVQLFFLKGVLHLWTVRMEMILYLILPFIIIILSLIKNDLYRSLFLIFSSVLSVYLFQVYQVSLFGTKDFIAIFILGMAAVHLKKYLPIKAAPYLAYVSFLLILILSTFAPWNSSFREFFGIYTRNDMYLNAYVFYPLCFLLLVSLSRFRSRFWGNKWLRLVGVCGYGFYLWHPMVIEFVRRFDLTGFVYQFSAYFLTLSLAVLTYICIEQPGIQLGRKLSLWVKANRATFFNMRPWGLCAIFLVGFLSYRQIYLIDKDIVFHINMWSSQDTVAQVYLQDGGNFKEAVSGHAVVKANQWQNVAIGVQAKSINKIRFDPGQKSGEYRIKDIAVVFPIIDKRVLLNIEDFQAIQGIQNLNNTEFGLEIITEKGTEDPILIYSGKNPYTFLTPWNLLGIAALWGCIIVLLLFIFIDKMKISLSARQKRTFRSEIPDVRSLSEI